ncbi:MAG: hypothetical protein H6575_15095 [Lewinellaceae bacterium]|nr:hypothetical protein [Lewinellaceae bacterium]
MPEHTLQKGIDFIDGLISLGEILGYYPKTEFPVEEGKRQGPAVDVAWFKEENQKFPLFIFEVESAATNSMTFNPMKVFSKENESFEKPLFFFQVILKKGEQSSRVSTLKKQFGTYNYRIYRLESEEKQKLIRDIIHQHRRISDAIDIFILVEFFKESDWIHIDLNDFIKLVINLEFEKNNGGILNDLVKLGAKYEDLIPIVSDYIMKIQSDPIINQYRINYNTYIGSHWYYPIHLGIIYCSTDELYWKLKSEEQLRYWQEKYTYLKMIGPYFGRNRDYDDFLIWGAGGLLGVVAALFKDNSKMRNYLGSILRNIIDSTGEEYKIPNLIWLFHICPKDETGKALKRYLLNSFKKFNGFKLKSFKEPLFFDNNDEFIEEFISGKDSIDDLDKLEFEKIDSNQISTALFLLTQESNIQLVNKEIVTILNN